MGASAPIALSREIGLSGPPPQDDDLEYLWETRYNEHMLQLREQVGIVSSVPGCSRWGVRPTPVDASIRAPLFADFFHTPFMIGSTRNR